MLDWLLALINKRQKALYDEVKQLRDDNTQFKAKLRIRAEEIQNLSNEVLELRKIVGDQVYRADVAADMLGNVVSINKKTRGG